MKSIKFYAVILLLIFISKLNFAQETERKIPQINLKDLQGHSFNTSDIKNDGPIVISFWATWCKPCIQELLAISENYEDWKEETGVKVFAISIDDARNSPKVAPFVNGRAWEFEVYLDENSDFKRAMNVNNIPHLFLVDKNGNIVWDHNSYMPGDEEHLHELLVKLAAGEKID